MGFKPYLKDQLASFSALTLLIVVVVVFSFIKQLSNATDTEVTWTIKYKFQINMLKQEQSV